jgi:hypothetical protein
LVGSIIGKLKITGAELKIVYTIIACIVLSVSLFCQELMHTTEFYWAEKFSDRSVEVWGVLEVNSPIFNDFLALAPDDRIVINRRGCEFHTDGTEEFTGLPYWVTLRAELREEPLSTVPTGFTRVYEYIWDVDLLPYLTGPIGIWQRFHDGNDGPDIHLELAGEGQFSDAPNGTVIFNGFNSGWIRTQKELKDRNHLLVAIYSEEDGHYKVSLNGETLIENDAYTIADTSSYSGQQFGVYNFGGTIARIQFTHIWYRCRQYSGKADFSQLESTDPNVTAVSSPKEVISSQENFALLQNFPNPFNPKTTISYSLAHSGMVYLKVYDLSGVEVSSLVQEYQSAGEFEIEFNASNLPSGIYLYRLRSGDFTQTKKLLHIK